MTCPAKNGKSEPLKMVFFVPTMLTSIRHKWPSLSALYSSGELNILARINFFGAMTVMRSEIRHCTKRQNVICNLKEQFSLHSP